MAARRNARRALSGVADFDGQLLAQDREGGLDLLGLGGVFGIEHAADHALVESQAMPRRSTIRRSSKPSASKTRRSKTIRAKFHRDVTAAYRPTIGFEAKPALLMVSTE
jgi:hypothetical protein